jgi:hypothetical protein
MKNGSSRLQDGFDPQPDRDGEKAVSIWQKQII